MSGAATGIRKAVEKDAKQLDGIIGKEFAYKKLDEEKIAERMRRPEITVFKKMAGGELAGFIEIEIFQDIAMINAISVKEGHRRKGFGKQLLGHALGFLAENGVRTARLLVKNHNEKAKKLYSSFGFAFTEMHDRKIDGHAAEVWEKELAQQAARESEYLN